MRDGCSELFDYLDVLQFLVVQCVLVIGGISLSDNADDLTFLGVELHHPGALAAFQLMEILLQQMSISATFDCQVNNGVVCTY